MTPQQELQLAFARAVCSEERAVVVLPDNHLGDVLPLVEAVRAGVAYAVRPDGDVLGLDCDHDRAVKALPEVAKRLATYRIGLVVLASGGHGRRHAWARLPSAEAKASVAELAQSFGIDTRPGAAGWLRPPLAPHRLGHLPRLLEPASPTAALELLRRRKHEALPARIDNLLRRGDLDGRYGADRSAVEQAILTSMVQRDWTMAAAFEVMSDPRHHGGAHTQELLASGRHREALRYFRRSWDRAEQFVADRPADRVDPTRAAIAAMRDGAATVVWKGKGGRTDQALLAALHEIAWRCNDLTVAASQRDLAEQLGMWHQTASKSLKRLQDAGWLRLAKRGEGQQASEYELVTPIENAPLPPSGGWGREVWSGAFSALGHDAVRRGGLSQSVARVYESLTLEPVTVADLAQELRMPRSTVRAALKALRPLRGAVPEQGSWPPRWLLGPADLDDIAAQLGVTGAAQRQAEAHDDERMYFTGVHPNGRRYVVLDAEHRATLARVHQQPGLDYEEANRLVRLDWAAGVAEEATSGQSPRSSSATTSATGGPDA